MEMNRTDGAEQTTTHLCRRPGRWLTKSLCSALFLLIAVPSFAQIKIGVSTPLTGDAQSYGDDIRKTLQFANEVLADNRYQLVFEDDRCNGKDAVTVAHKLLEVDKVGFVLGLPCSGALLAAAPIYEKGKAIVISAAASSPSVSGAGEYVFRTWPSDSEAARVLRFEIENHHQTVGILSEHTDFTRAFADAFRATGQKNSLSIVEEEFAPGSTDLRAIVAKLKHKNVEALFLNTQTEATLLQVLRQVREQKISVPVYNAFWASSPIFRREAGAAANGLIYVDSPTIDSALTSSGRELYRQFVAKYGDMTSKPLLFVSAFESFRAVHEAIVSGHDPKTFLNGKTFEGIHGSWRFSADGDPLGTGTRPYLTMRIDRIGG